MPLGELLVEMSIISPEILKKALNLQHNRLGNILIELGEATENQIKQALQKQQITKQNDTLKKQNKNNTEKQITININSLHRLKKNINSLISTITKKKQEANFKSHDDFSSTIESNLNNNMINIKMLQL